MEGKKKRVCPSKISEEKHKIKDSPREHGEYGLKIQTARETPRADRGRGRPTNNYLRKRSKLPKRGLSEHLRGTETKQNVWRPEIKRRES